MILQGFLIFVFVDSVVLLLTLGDLFSAHTFASDSSGLIQKKIQEASIVWLFWYQGASISF